MIILFIYYKLFIGILGYFKENLTKDINNSRNMKTGKLLYLNTKLYIFSIQLYYSWINLNFRRTFYKLYFISYLICFKFGRFWSYLNYILIVFVNQSINSAKDRIIYAIWFSILPWIFHSFYLTFRCIFSQKIAWFFIFSIRDIHGNIRESVNPL